VNAVASTAVIPVPWSEWVRGDYCTIAVVKRTASDFEQKLGVRFDDDMEDGLGRIKAAGFKMANGRFFTLIEHLQAPERPSLSIGCLNDQHFSTDLEDVLEALDLASADLMRHKGQLCISSHAVLVPHVLYRQDDNGNKVVANTFPCRADATRQMKLLEHAVHKQTYWVEALV